MSGLLGIVMLVLKRLGGARFLIHSSKHQPFLLLHRFTDMPAYLYNHNCKGFHARGPIPQSFCYSVDRSWKHAPLPRRNNFTVKCCFSNGANSNSTKRHANAFENLNAQLVSDVDSELRRSDSIRLPSQNGLQERGSLNGFHSHTLSRDKIVVAVDVDEVLGNFVSALNRFIADRYAANHSVSEYHVYEFFKIWKCSRDEADLRVHEFFKTSYFKTGIHPLPGAKETLHKLSGVFNLSIVTSRQNAIKDHTIQWIENHFPGLFQEIHFGNHFALNGESRPKSEICRSLGAKVLIDDNPRYALECAEVGIRVLLFDYENSYPWCKTQSIDQHPLVTKVHNWEAVEKQLMALIVS